MRAINFENYLFRCSSLGKLMTGIKEPLTEKQILTLAGLIEKRAAYIEKGKPLADGDTKLLGDLMTRRDTKPELSTTAKTYLKTLHREEFMHRNKTIQSKYLEKGIIVEEKSISLYTDVFGKLLVKNKIRFADKYKTGEPDNCQKIVRDFKSSFDFTTFPMYEEEIPNQDYFWQLQGYMDLTGMDNAELIYCLIDTPNKIVDDELRRLDWKYGILNLEGEVKDESIPMVVEKVQEMIYTEYGLDDFCAYNSVVKKQWFTDFYELPKESRIKVFEVQKDKVKLEMLHEQITKSREFLNGLTITLANQLVA